MWKLKRKEKKRGKLKCSFHFEFSFFCFQNYYFSFLFEWNNWCDYGKVRENFNLLNSEGFTRLNCEQLKKWKAWLFSQFSSILNNKKSWPNLHSTSHQNHKIQKFSKLKFKMKRQKQAQIISKQYFLHYNICSWLLNRQNFSEKETTIMREILNFNLKPLLVFLIITLHEELRDFQKFSKF